MKIHPNTKPLVDTLVWLLDPEANRGEGRSTLMALAFIEIAKRHPGKWVDVFDHYAGQMADRNAHQMIERIRGLIDSQEMVKTPDGKELGSLVPLTVPTPYGEVPVKVLYDSKRFKLVIGGEQAPVGHGG
jgi:hypothetical protein